MPQRGSVPVRADRDFRDAVENYANDPSVKVELWDNRADHLRITITGEKQTPYEGGKFVFEIKMPSNYPFAPPSLVYCHTKIWHPNIASDFPTNIRNVCLDLINVDYSSKINPATGGPGWTPVKTLQNIIESFRLMLRLEPPFVNPHNPLNYEAAKELIQSSQKFEKTAKEYTQKYAK